MRLRRIPLQRIVSAYFPFPTEIEFCIPWPVIVLVPPWSSIVLVDPCFVSLTKIEFWVAVPPTLTLPEFINVLRFPLPTIWLLISFFVPCCFIVLVVSANAMFESVEKMQNETKIPNNFMINLYFAIGD